MSLIWCFRIIGWYWLVYSQFVCCHAREYHSVLSSLSFISNLDCWCHVRQGTCLEQNHSANKVMTLFPFLLFVDLYPARSDKLFMAPRVHCRGVFWSWLDNWIISVERSQILAFSLRKKRFLSRFRIVDFLNIRLRYRILFASFTSIYRFGGKLLYLIKFMLWVLMQGFNVLLNAALFSTKMLKVDDRQGVYSCIFSWSRKRNYIFIILYLWFLKYKIKNPTIKSLIKFVLIPLRIIVKIFCWIISQI